MTYGSGSFTEMKVIEVSAEDAEKMKEIARVQLEEQMLEQLSTPHEVEPPQEKTATPVAPAWVGSMADLMTRGDARIELYRNNVWYYRVVSAVRNAEMMGVDPVFTLMGAMARVCTVNDELTKTLAAHTAAWPPASLKVVPPTGDTE
jgi:hypothetical protein